MQQLSNNEDEELQATWETLRRLNRRYGKGSSRKVGPSNVVGDDCNSVDPLISKGKQESEGDEGINYDADVSYVNF